MHEAKKTARALVRIGFDGRVHKSFLAKDAATRFANEVKVLRYLERRGCKFVPRLLEADPEQLKIVTTNCGALVEHISDEKLKELFAELESYGVRHDDPFQRNITYRASDGRFCIIDFEFATILAEERDGLASPSTAMHREHADDSKLASDLAGVPRSLTFRWSGLTDRGKFRPNNEDVFLAMAFDMRELHYLGKNGEEAVGGRDFVFAVSDGMGGEKSGEFASRYTIDNIVRLLPRRFHMAPAHYASGIANCLHDLFQNIHAQLTKLGQSYAEGHNMGATLSLVWYVGDWFHFGHLGDSRIYHLPRAGGLRQVTEDHTHVGWLRRAGQLNERQAHARPQKRAGPGTGAGNQRIVPQIGLVHCEPGDRLLLCSDGVIEGLWDRALEELLRQPPTALADQPPAQRLVQAAVAESGRDNATAVVIEIV